MENGGPAVGPDAPTAKLSFATPLESTSGALLAVITSVRYLRHSVALALLISMSAIMTHSAEANRQSSRLRDYKHSLYGATTIGGSAVSGAIGQLRNSPHEWGGG